MTCPDESQLAAFLDGNLTPDRTATIAAHVDQCETCQARLDRMLPTEDVIRTDGVRDNGLLSEHSGNPGAEYADPSERLTPEDRSALAALIQRLQTAETRLAEPGLHGPSPPDGPAAPIPESDLPATLDRYLLTELVGEGATGRLYRARDERLGRSVAVKILKPELAAVTSARTRFEREARACAALRHDHIVAVHHVEASHAGHAPYFVMEFVEGGSLQPRLDVDGGVPLRQRVEWIRQAATALQAAHDAGIIHRDIKPSNLLIDESTGRLRVADFGLARLTEAEESLTADDAIAGTPAYMSPEQIARPKDVSGLSDVYSLGVVLYEALCGERPFRGSIRMVLNQVQHEEPVPPRRLNDRIPRDLETICLKAMAKDPRSRYASAQEFARDLQRWLEGRSVLARPIGPIERLWRWGRRNPRLAGATGIVTAVLIAGAVDWGQLRRSSVENQLRQEWQREARRQHDLLTESTGRARTAERRWLQSLETIRRLIAAGNARQVSERPDSEPLKPLESLTEDLLNQTVPDLATVIAARELSTIWMQLGHPSRSEPLLLRAETQARRLLMEDSGNPGLVLTLAGIQTRLADLKLSDGNSNESLRLLRAARDLISSSPASRTPQAVFDLARIEHRLGDVEEHRNRFGVAVSHFDQSLEYLKSPLLHDHPALLDSQALVTLKLASALSHDNPERARTVCREACRLNETLAATGDRAARLRTAAAYGELARNLARSGDSPRAITAAQRRCDLMQQLAADEPEQSATARALGAAWLQLATLHAQQADWSAAADAADRAVTQLRTTTDDPDASFEDQLTLGEAELLAMTARASDGSAAVPLERLRSLERRITRADSRAGHRAPPALRLRADTLLTQCRNLIDAASSEE